MIPDGTPDGRQMRCMEIHGGSHAVVETLATPGLEAWVCCRPHEGVDLGGDVHYLSLCGGGVITRLIVADVSGHGAAVAEFATSLRQLMRKNINTKSQTRLVRALNREFGALAQTQRFATAVVATYLATQRRLTVCNAGHPRPLHFQAKSATWSFLDQSAEESANPGNLPLGFDEETPYQQFALTLGVGDLALFYTDALIEAADASGRLLGEPGLLDLVQGLDPTEFERLGPDLLSALERHRAGLPADDDLTLVVLRHMGGGPRGPSLFEKVSVFAKVFGLKPV